MRKIIVSSALLLAVAASPACKEPDPNLFETHVEKLKDPSKRAAGFTGLETLVKAVVTAPDNKDRLEEFGTKVIPVFEEIWDTAPEQREQMLKILMDVGHPSGAPLWNKAIPLDGSAEARKETLLALEGIRKAKAAGTAEALQAELESLVKNPKNDKGKEQGRVRLEIVETLGTIGAKSAVPLLIKVMEQTKENQPVAVHRAAAKALGEIGDPSAVDALLTVTFRVPDSPSTSDISNRSKLALVSIGDPAVPGVMKMLRGEHEAVNELANKNGVDVMVVKQSAAGILAAMGTKAATEELVAFMPKADCEDPGAETSPSDGNLRAFVANALGFIGDEAAVDALCGCSMASKNPADMWEVSQALGRIGGAKATACLVEVMKNGEYKDDAIDGPQFKYEIRSEAGRSAVLAASAAELDAVKGAFAAQKDKNVVGKLEQWKSGLKLLEDCKADKACYQKTLKDTSADWFAREKAAFELARMSKGDAGVAAEISKAFKVRNPDARVSMAWLPARMLEGAKCSECAVALEDVIKGEKGTMPKEMQLAVLTARYTMAKLAGGGAAAGGKAPAKAPAKADGKAPAKADAKAPAKADAKAPAKAG